MSVKTNKTLPLLDAGHEVATEQFKLQVKLSESKKIRVDGPMHIYQLDPRQSVVISGENFVVRFNQKTGELTGYQYKGKELVRSPLRANFWKAPNDNDYGGQWHDKRRVWKYASERQFKQQFSVEKQDNNTVLVRSQFNLPDVEGTLSIDYLIDAGGQVEVNYKLNLSEKATPEIPRVGMTMELFKSFDQLTYFGRGPHENYRDRNSSAHVGLYTSSVAEQYHPYVRAQESGYKTQVRWAKLTDKEGIGLSIKGAPHFGMSALHYRIADLDSGRTREGLHSGELTPRPLVNLNIDYGQMGVGGVQSWGATELEQYLLTDNEYTYTFPLTGVVERE